MDNPYFSVVIPTYNRQAQLALCLDALASQSLDVRLFEVIVVDDGSTDGSAENVRKRAFPFPCKVLTVPNGGASEARNRGIKEARGGFIALTEDDVIPDSEWLAAAKRDLDAGGIDVLEGRTVYLGTATDVRRFEKTGIPSFIPCNLFVRRTVFDDVGGYDPAFFDARAHLYFREDADLGFRLLDAGYTVAFGREAVVAHPRQFGELRECLRHSRRYVFDPLLYRKHPLRYRACIEVKTIGGITIHRPQHLVALLYVACLAGMAWSATYGSLRWMTGLAAVAFVCSCLFRYRYQGIRTLRLHRLKDTIGFLAVPIVYIGAVCKGCIRYRTVGPLL